MSIYERNGKFYCRFQINGERHNYLCNGADTKAKAKQIESAFMFKVQQQQNGIIQRDDKQCGIGVLINDFLEYSKLNKRSYRTDFYRCRGIIEYFGMNYKVNQITPKAIDEFKAASLKKGRSQTTINRYLEVLSKACNLGVANEKIKINPIKGNMKFRHKNYTVRYLTEDEEERLYKHLPKWLEPIITTALNTGLRRENIRLLKWSNIDFNFNLIEILENKGNKHIKLPLNKTMIDLLKELKLENSSEYVFADTKTKEPYTNERITYAWEKAKQAARIENFRFHDLRHTVGTRLAKANVPINVIKDILAHSDVATTMRYVHTAALDMQNAMSVLNSYN